MYGGLGARLAYLFDHPSSVNRPRRGCPLRYGGGRTIGPALRAGRAIARNLRKPTCSFAAIHIPLSCMAAMSDVLHRPVLRGGSETLSLQSHGRGRDLNPAGLGSRPGWPLGGSSRG